MRTNEARARMVRARAAEIRKKDRKKRRFLDAACIAACLLLVAGIGAWMPGWMAGVSASGVRHASGAASLLGSHAALGYILIGLCAFLLGVCVTVLLYRLRRRNERGRRERGDDEL